MNIRKVHKVGNGALTITLPINDCRSMGIVPGTYVRTERIENTIILTPVDYARQDMKSTGAEPTHLEVCRNG